MIQHVVLLKFKAGTTQAQIEALERMLEPMPNTIVEIQTYEFGRDIAGTESSYDFGLVSLFANLDAVKRYQEHPDHVKVLEHVARICSHVITVDFELSYQTPDYEIPPFLKGM